MVLSDVSGQELLLFFMKFRSDNQSEISRCRPSLVRAYSLQFVNSYSILAL